jgi:hypothetical protein
MSTRSITAVMEDGQELLTMYRQSDGYPSGHGQELADFLKGFKVVNGISGGAKQEEKIANGLGCLAAQIVAHFKQPGKDYKYTNGALEVVDAKSSIGQFYIVPAAQREAYNYFITLKNDVLTLRVKTEEGTLLFDGIPEEFDAAAIEAE